MWYFARDVQGISCLGRVVDILEASGLLTRVQVPAEALLFLIWFFYRGKFLIFIGLSLNPYSIAEKEAYSRIKKFISIIPANEKSRIVDDRPVLF